MRRWRVARASVSRRYVALQHRFTKLLARPLPNNRFHLQVKKRSENFRRVQGGAVHNVIHRPRRVHRRQIALRRRGLFRFTSLKASFLKNVRYDAWRAKEQRKSFGSTEVQ
jgi:hypothetical protein